MKFIKNMLDCSAKNQLTTTGNRIDWIDVSRGLAFLMIIYRHLDGYKNDFVMLFFQPVFISIFFFVSGYLFKEKQTFLKVFEQRTRTLLLPFLMLGSIVIVMSQCMSFNESISWIDRFKGLLFQNHKNQLLWFIAAIYIYSLVFYWIERFCKSDSILLLVSVFLYIGNGIYNYCFGFESYTSVWHVGMLGYSCFYMGLGKLYKRHESKIIFSRKMLLFFAITYFLIILISQKSYGFVGSPMIVDCMYITTIGLILFVYACKRMPLLKGNAFLKFVGANTLFYFAFHGKVYAVLIKITEKILVQFEMLHNSLAINVSAFLLTFATAVLLIPMTMFVNRYLSFLLGKGFRLYNCK